MSLLRSRGYREFPNGRPPEVSESVVPMNDFEQLCKDFDEATIFAIKEGYLTHSAFPEVQAAVEAWNRQLASASTVIADGYSTNERTG